MTKPEPETYAARVAVALIVCVTVVLVAFMGMCVAIAMVTDDVTWVTAVGDVLVRILASFHDVLL